MKKRCISCGIEKPKTSRYFYYRNKKKGYLSSWCKDCRKKKRKETLGAELRAQTARRRKASKKRTCKYCDDVYPGDGRTVCDACALKKKRREKQKGKCLYRRRLRKAMPTWADKEEIKKIYAECPDGMVVDHIIPISGEFISGLHVPDNLQYLTQLENATKGNKWP